MESAKWDQTRRQYLLDRNIQAFRLSCIIFCIFNVGLNQNECLFTCQVAASSFFIRKRSPIVYRSSSTIPGHLFKQFQKICRTCASFHKTNDVFCLPFFMTLFDKHAMHVKTGIFLRKRGRDDVRYVEVVVIWNLLWEEGKENSTGSGKEKDRPVHCGAAARCERVFRSWTICTWRSRLGPTSSNTLLYLWYTGGRFSCGVKSDRVRSDESPSGCPDTTATREAWRRG